METKYPEIKQIFDEFVNTAQFAQGTDIGPSTENIGIIAAGDAGDWITAALGIPAAEAEIGAWDQYSTTWFPHSTSVAFQIVNDNINWLEHTYMKLGNQITL